MERNRARETTNRWAEAVHSSWTTIIRPRPGYTHEPIGGSVLVEQRSQRFHRTGASRPPTNDRARITEKFDAAYTPAAHLADWRKLARRRRLQSM